MEHRGILTHGINSTLRVSRCSTSVNERGINFASFQPPWNAISSDQNHFDRVELIPRYSMELIPQVLFHGVPPSGNVPSDPE